VHEEPKPPLAESAAEELQRHSMPWQSAQRPSQDAAMNSFYIWNCNSSAAQSVNMQGHVFRRAGASSVIQMTITYRRWSAKALRR